MNAIICEINICARKLRFLVQEKSPAGRCHEDLAVEHGSTQLVGPPNDAENE